MKAIESRLLVQIDSTTEKQKIGNFEMPVTEYETAKVLSVGDKITEVKAGDSILIYTGAGKEFTRDGEKYRVLTINEVIVVL